MSIDALECVSEKQLIAVEEQKAGGCCCGAARLIKGGCLKVTLLGILLKETALTRFRFLLQDSAL